jgi:hypothetical protein
VANLAMHRSIGFDRGDELVQGLETYLERPGRLAVAFDELAARPASLS